MSTAPNFDRLAGIYRWMEYATFGPWLSCSRSVFLPQLADCRHALVFGDGDGRFTARLLHANPAIHIHAVDASPAMLSALVRRAGPQAARVQTQLTDARQWRPETPNGSGMIPGPDPNLRYDVILTHFFLDCLTTEQVQSLATALREAVSPNAIWVVSDFAIPHGWYGRLVARPLVSTLYRAFGRLTGLAVRTLPDHGSALRAAGFDLDIRRPWLGGLLISELWHASPLSQP